MKIRKIFLVTLMAGMMVFAFPGCGAQKYHVDYCGEESFYLNAKEYYRAGKTVTVYYNMIATDTDYSFTLDGEPISCSYNEKKGFEITFVMPAHDVKLECDSRNSMEYYPEDYTE